jgi:hypothetical protein
MFNSLFGFGKKRTLSIYPSKASDSVSSLALLLVTNGHPFSSWKEDGLEIAENEVMLIRRLCNAYQLFLYPTQFSDMTLGDILVGCALAIAKAQQPELMAATEYEVSVIDFAFRKAVQTVEEDAILQVMALTLVEHFSPKLEFDLDDLQVDAMAHKLARCLVHAGQQAKTVFQPMVESITDFDLGDIQQITYRLLAPSFFEACLKKRDQFKFLYIHKEPPNAKLLYDCRKKEAAFADDMQTKFAGATEELLNSPDGLDAKGIYDAVSNWYFKVDDICTELKIVGGVAPTMMLESLNQRREELLPSLNRHLAEALNDQQETDKLFSAIKKRAFEFSEKSEVALALKLQHLPSDEICSYLLTLPIDQFKQLNQMKRGDFEPGLVSAGVYEHADAKEAAYIEERLSSL